MYLEAFVLCVRLPDSLQKLLTTFKYSPCVMLSFSQLLVVLIIDSPKNCHLKMATFFNYSYKWKRAFKSKNVIYAILGNRVARQGAEKKIVQKYS